MNEVVDERIWRREGLQNGLFLSLVQGKRSERRGRRRRRGGGRKIKREKRKGEEEN